MKEIYLNILQLLSPSPQPAEPKQAAVYNQLKKLQWVDIDKGQLEFYQNRPPVAFPCALINIEINKTENLGNNIQRCLIGCSIRIAFDYIGETSAKTPKGLTEQSLAYFDLLQAVYLALQGKKNGTGRFDRQSLTEEKRPDGLKTINMRFTTEWIDKSASL